MADFSTISEVGSSIVRLLNRQFQETVPVENQQTRAVLVRTEDLRAADDQTPGFIQEPAMAVFLYRVDRNRTMTAAWSSVARVDGLGHLPLDLHYLLIPWATSAEFEHRILGSALQCLEAEPILTGPLLGNAGGFSDGDAIQLTYGEITTEAVMRTFETLPIDYKLCVPYVARVVRIDQRRRAVVPPVVTTQISRIAQRSGPSPTGRGDAE